MGAAFEAFLPQNARQYWLFYFPRSKKTVIPNPASSGEGSAVSYCREKQIPHKMPFGMTN
jgi:hypothetical protein